MFRVSALSSQQYGHGRRRQTTAEKGCPTPLCVDLDGTLVKTDTLHEQLLLAAMRWHCLLRLLSWLQRGRAYLKQQLALAVPLDIPTLPYNEPLIQHLRQQRALGRRLVLATGANRRVATAINAHLHLFDEIIASDVGKNLTGSAKATALCERFGARQFSYVGSGLHDIAVWKVAASAIVVDPRRGILRAAIKATSIEEQIGSRRSRLATFARALRPYQWSKNLLVFIPLLTSVGAFTDVRGWIASFTVFGAFCLAASGIYLANDLTDLAADRRHPSKRRRPFASGGLPVIYGLGAAPLLIAGGIALAGGCGAGVVLAAYVILSLLYSLKLKEQPLVDIFGLAGLYAIRLFAGGIASHHPVSLWLLMFSSFLFFSLACIKRVAELKALPIEDKKQLRRRGYAARDLEILEIMGIGASFVSSTVMGLYVQGNGRAPQWVHPEWLWAMIPLLLFWQCRLWLATSHGDMHDDPIVYASRDWLSRGVVAVAIVVYLLASAIL